MKSRSSDSSLIRIGLYVVLAVSLLDAKAAGNRVGNGGKAVVCGEPGKTPVADLLDFYERNKDPVLAASKSAASLKAGTSAKYDPAASVKDATAMFSERLNLLAKVHPRLSMQFSKRLATFPNELEFESDSLVGTEDSFHLIEPREKYCTIEQAAIRREELMDGEKRFVIAREVWKVMSPRARAGLLSHEIVYEYFYRLGDRDSRKARKYNEMLFDPNFEKKTKEEYWAFVRGLKIAIYD